MAELAARNADLFAEGDGLGEVGKEGGSGVHGDELAYPQALPFLPMLSQLPGI